MANAIFALAGRRAFAATAGLIVTVFVGTPAMAADLVDTAQSDGRFGTFLEALRSADLDDELRQDGRSFTVFAPTDEAFRRLPSEFLDKLMSPANAQPLERVLGLHIVPGNAYAQDDIPVELQPRSGDRLIVTYTGGELTVRPAPADAVEAVDPTIADRRQVPARVIPGAIEADNGVLQAIDTVLLPEDLGTLKSQPEDQPEGASHAGRQRDVTTKRSATGRQRGERGR
ncbi:fasciclin domain-containing protein [Jiella pelagia]|uniref:Fasciclin domain-containing protein n=1 Tax=Jiella pelagia TaxID=2986949 RepID=A0ABY7BVT1_9HYPH|nr:fasciclin domain-containing protein [Jiella pelagia]WAP67472.1 fasciclin domain-containing protein [Jiella pelagia]